MTNLIPAAQMPELFPGTSEQYWATLRHKGGGPAYVKCQRKVYYRAEDVQSWLESNRYTRTDQPATA